MAQDRVALIRQIKDASDIVAVVGSYLPLRPAGSTFKALCPFHNDSRPSLDVDPRRQRYRCWACGEFGDVFEFVQKFERVPFMEAVRELARRANVSFDDPSPQDRTRARLLDAARWAAERYAECLIDAPLAADARKYLTSRALNGPTVRQFGLGFAPPDGKWLVEQAGRQNRVSFEVLEEVGLVGRSRHGPGYYDRFRDRVMFPIRDARGQVVGFGGRLLPGSPLADTAPKYYNSAETPLFKKKELLFGLDAARYAATKAGYLAVVEGYTDVMMAHQCGVPQVVATMGTALNERHVVQLLRYTKIDATKSARVVLVFDADAGGQTGVDRALEIFIRQDVDLTIATLPDGLDPCDLLVAQGAAPFLAALGAGIDALDFKLNQVLALSGSAGVQGRLQVLEQVLGLMAGSPDAASISAKIKQDLILTRLVRRLDLDEKVIRARLVELRREYQRKQKSEAELRARRGVESGETGPVQARPRPRVRDQRPAAAAPTEERELLEVLVAFPKLVPVAHAALRPEELTHPVGRTLLSALFSVHEAGEVPDVEALRDRLDNPALFRKVLELQEIGLGHGEPDVWLAQLLGEFRKRPERQTKSEVRGKLGNTSDHADALEQLSRLRGPGAAGQSDSTET